MYRSAIRPLRPRVGLTALGLGIVVALVLAIFVTFVPGSSPGVPSDTVFDVATDTENPDMVLDDGSPGLPPAAEKLVKTTDGDSGITDIGNGNIIGDDTGLGDSIVPYARNSEIGFAGLHDSISRWPTNIGTFDDALSEHGISVIITDAIPARDDGSGISTSSNPLDPGNGAFVLIEPTMGQGHGSVENVVSTDTGLRFLTFAT